MNQDQIIQCLYQTKKEILLDILAELFSFQELYQIICDNRDDIFHNDKRYKRHKRDKRYKRHKKLRNLNHPDNQVDQVDQVDQDNQKSTVEPPNCVERLEPHMLFQYRGPVSYDPFFRAIGQSPYF